MSKVILLLILALSTVSLSPGPDHKIEICHVPPGNPANAHTIEVDLASYTEGHNPHNSHSLDYVGACRVDPTPTQTSPTPTPRPTSTPVDEPTPIPTLPPIGTCALEQAECNTCAQLEIIAYELGRIANALEAANE